MGGYKPYKEFLFKISETAKVNHFNILVDLCHIIIEKKFLVVQVPLGRDADPSRFFRIRIRPERKYSDSDPDSDPD